MSQRRASALAADSQVVTIDVGNGIVRKSLASQVYDALERAIITARIPPATRLGEDAIASAFKVSRSPAREAIAELERIGLAERLSNRDRRVTVPTEAFITDVFDVWMLLESERLCEASEQATAEDAARIEALLDKYERTDPADDERKDALLLAFHKALQEGCKNRQLHRVADDWYRYIRWFRRLYVDYHSESSAEALAEHREIVRCFREKDRAGMARVMRQHIAAHRNRILEAWRQTNAAELAASSLTVEFTLHPQVS